MTTIQTQNFGVEIELTGITREKAAKTIAAYFETNSYRHIGGTYDTWTAYDREGRIWKAMFDSSIRATKKVNGEQIHTNDYRYKCEVVTPILRYEDMADLQQLVRTLVKKGAVANESCGIHVHVDGANHTPDSLSRLLNFAVGRQDLFYEALQIGARADRWCHKANKALFKAIKKDHADARAIERLWYSALNDGYRGGISHNHYNDTRYHGINLHAYFTKGTVEFRLFNGTTHAGKIKAYVQFCLAMSAWSINCEKDNLFFKSTADMTQEQKAALMLRVLTKRLGMRGPEFKTARLHLTSAFTQTAAAVAA